MKLGKWRIDMSTYEQWLRSNRETRGALSKALIGLFWVIAAFVFLWATR